MARLASGLWVAAYLRRLQMAAIPAYVLSRGDETAGAILVKVATLDGRATLWQRGYDFETDTRAWQLRLDGAEAEVDAAIAAERRTDPDLWVLEVEDREGRSLLDAEGLA